MVPEVEQLHSRARSLFTEFQHGCGTNYIDEAIVLYREALELCPPGHADRSTSLYKLATCLFTRYKELGKMEDLNEVIVLDRDALALRQPRHPYHASYVGSLAIHLSARFQKLGKMEDLNEAVALNRDALTLCPPGHPDRPKSLNNLSFRLTTRYRRFGEMEDLNEAIVLTRDALALLPSGHPTWWMSLDNLASNLSNRYRLLGAREDLDEAIILSRDALALCTPEHHHRTTSLGDLAVRLYSRHKQLGAMEDLNEAIVLGRDALALRPPEHPDRSTTLNSLALHLSARYKKLKDVKDLDEAIVLAREALALRPPGDPARSAGLSNLALHLSTRYKQLRKADDLREAIDLDRAALALRPPGHTDRSASLNNLSIDLFTRYKRFGAMQDLSEAIVLGRDTLALRPPGHTDRLGPLYGLARNLSARYKKLGEMQDLEEAFSLYAELAHVRHIVSLSDLFAANAWVGATEQHDHPTKLLAYKTTLRLLVQHISTLPSLPQHFDLLKNLTSSLAVDAFSACLRNQSPTMGVELLEQGRGVFWNQLSRLRSPLEDVIASGPAGKTLADRFTELTSLIRKALDSPGVDQHDRVSHLNVELQRVVTNIRALPDLSHFLSPPLFSDIQHAACKGPVVIVNASKYSCDALMVLPDREPVHIPLSITQERVRQLSSTLRNLTVRAKTTDMTREFAIILRELWDDVVSRVVDSLQTIYPRQSRIWWCPTAEFSLLPLHAAGQYRKGGRNLAHLYISSYTPTLTALIRARRHDPSQSGVERKRFVAIGQVSAVGESLKELVSVGTELAHLAQRIDSLATFTRIEGTESTVARVSEELGKNEWVHFACHGLPNRQRPFESAFALYDGHFTIHHITQCHLENPQFAYLSACHTTVGDEESPDEVIHLASAMQFAGFRSVIGTMWAVDDAQTNKIMSMFYEHMVDETGHLDHTRAAFALHKTMKKLTNIPFDQRILYIHLGA